VTELEAEVEIDHKCHPKKEHRILRDRHGRNLGWTSITKTLISGDESKMSNRVDFVVIGDGFAAND